VTNWANWRIKANLHWEVARKSRARFLVCLTAPRSCRARAENYPTQQTKQRITRGTSSV